jgi:ATP-dependent Lon protease
VIAPSLNEADVEEIPEHLRRDLTFVFVDEIADVLEVALEQPSSNGRRRRRAPANRRV